MIIQHKHTFDGKFLKPSVQIRERYFKGKFEAWFLYEELERHDSKFLKTKQKKDIMKLTGLTSRKWDKAVSELIEMGFLRIYTNRFEGNNSGKLYEFSNIPVNEWIIKIEKEESCASSIKEESSSSNIQSKVNYNLGDLSHIPTVKPTELPTLGGGFNEELELPF
jgi:hypothetical protein